jgi:hypothetical protein
MKVFGWLLCMSMFAWVGAAAAQSGTTHRTTADGRPLASSLPTKTAPTRAQPRPLAFQELGQHVGERVRIVTEYGDRKEGKIDSVNGSTLHLRIAAGAGYAVTNFERAHLRSITLLPW